MPTPPPDEGPEPPGPGPADDHDPDHEPDPAPTSASPGVPGSPPPPHATPAERTARGLPLPAALLALTVVSGIIDAVSYLALGHVFTANMTGNVVVLGFAAAGAQGFFWARVLASLGAFLAGSAAGGWAGRRFAAGGTVRGTAGEASRPGAPDTPAGRRWRGSRARRTWLRWVFTTEAVLLGASSGVAAQAPGRTATLYTLIAVTAFAMGLRNATVRRLGVADLTTTVLTMTLTGLAADSPLGDGRPVRTVRRLGSTLALLGGAVLGAWLVLHHGLWPPLLVAAAISGALALTVSGRVPSADRGPASR